MAEIPEEVLALCNLDDFAEDASPLTLKHADKNSCTVLWGPMELRFQTINGEWFWDEVVGDALVHVEMMDNHLYWIGFSGDWGRVCVHIGARRAPVRMTGWTETP